MKKWMKFVLMVTMSLFFMWCATKIAIAEKHTYGENKVLKENDGIDSSFFDSQIQFFVPEALVTSTPRLTMLMLSGGGSYGPWGTGVLEGWKSDGRPSNFTVVTGVSTGAMIAPFAYLKHYLDKNIFPDYVKHRNNIQRKRIILELPFSNSLSV